MVALAKQSLSRNSQQIFAYTLLERREVKNKGKRESYIQLNAEFQRIARRDKKTFFNEQCIKLEENNRRVQLEIFSGKLVTIKYRKSRDLIDTEESKKKWKEYTEELFKKDLNKPDYYDGQSVTQSQTFWTVKSSGPQEALLLIKLVDAMEFQQSY